MRLLCTTCGKSVSNEVPDSTIVRAALTCPECIGKLTYMREATTNEELEKISRIVLTNDKT